MAEIRMDTIVIQCFIPIFLCKTPKKHDINLLFTTNMRVCCALHQQPFAKLSNTHTSIKRLTYTYDFITQSLLQKYVVIFSW